MMWSTLEKFYVIHFHCYPECSPKGPTFFLQKYSNHLIAGPARESQLLYTGFLDYHMTNLPLPPRAPTWRRQICTRKESYKARCISSKTVFMLDHKSVITDLEI